MIDPFWLSLAMKMAASAGVIVVASAVAERSGPFFGAMIATLPVSAGPAYVLLAMEHGAAFLEKSSLVSLAVNAATAVFILTYASLAPRRSLLVSLPAALLVWLIAAWGIMLVDWTVPGALMLNALALGVAFLVIRPLVKDQGVSAAPDRRWWDMPARAIAVMCLVGVVVLVGQAFGPKVAGIAALVPIVMTSLAFILHPRVGGRATASVLANALPGLIGFALALVALHFVVVPLGAVTALMLALVVCVSWNLGLILIRR